MKNEVLTQAITGIDDELIVSAHHTAFSRPKRIKYFGICAAACLLLVCGALLFSRSGGMTIRMDGNIVSTQPVAVPSVDTRQAKSDGITVLLEIAAKEELNIRAAAGTVEAEAPEKGEKGPVTLQWTIEDPAVGETYEMKVNDVSLILKYDPDTNNWTLNKTED